MCFSIKMALKSGAKHTLTAHFLTLNALSMSTPSSCDCETGKHNVYLFFWLDQSWMTQEIIALNSNSAQPGINQTGVRGLPFSCPTN